MLVDYFELIPTIPDYVPLPASRERARARFASFVGGPWEALAVVTNQIEFYPAWRTSRPSLAPPAALCSP
jgi:hypothetical protein